MYKNFPGAFRPPPSFDPFESRIFLSENVRNAYYPPHPYHLTYSAGIPDSEAELIRARFTLLDAFGQIMLKKYWDGVHDMEYVALAQIIYNAYLEEQEKSS